MRWTIDIEPRVTARCAHRQAHVGTPSAQFGNPLFSFSALRGFSDEGIDQRLTAGDTRERYQEFVIAFGRVGEIPTRAWTYDPPRVPPGALQ